MITVMAIFFSVALCGVALWANRRFRDEARLPMQWWLNGEVTWSAPRRVALAFMPALAIVMLAALVILFHTVPARPGQERLVVPTMIAIGVILLGSQLFHLRMIDRALRRRSG